MLTLIPYDNAFILLRLHTIHEVESADNVRFTSGARRMRRDWGSETTCHRRHGLTTLSLKLNL